jgi:putative ABC transport system permease protein
MTLLHRCASVLRWLANRNRAEQDLNDELQAFVEMAAADKEHDGRAPAEAHRLAVLQLGGVEQVKERVRTARHGSRLEEVGRDVRFAVRMCARNPGFSAVVVLTLGLGIGANTAIFSVVNAVLLRPLAWNDPEGLVMVWHHNDHNPEARWVMSLPDLRDVAELPAVETVAGFGSFTATVTSLEEPELVDATFATNGLMETFRVHPFMGRDLTAEDSGTGRPLVVVVSHHYWRQRLGGRADVLGTTLELFDVPREIVGVAPAGFDFPDGTQLWVPQGPVPPECGRDCHSLNAIARLTDGAAFEAFSSELRALAMRLSEAYPDTNLRKRFRAVRLADDQVAHVRGGLWFILGAVSLVLLIACANVANLFLVRGVSRRGEMAVRSALGASRARLASQVLIESALLAAGGAVIGVGLAFAAIVFVRTMPAGTVPRIDTVGLDANVLLFTLAVSAVVTLLFGVSAASRQARRPVAADLISERRGGGGPHASRARSLLLAAEVAVSVLLLTGTGLMLKSFDRLYSVDLGFETERLARFRVVLPDARYDTIADVVTFYETLEERLAVLPGVVSVGSASAPPLSPGVNRRVLIEGRPPPEPGAEMFAYIHSITPGYFETMRLPLVRGRGIDANDRSGSVPVAVVSQTFVDEHFPNEDPIGKRFNLEADLGLVKTWTIVGIAGDVRRSLTIPPRADVYFPLGQFDPGGLTVHIRTAAGVAPTVAAIRDELRSIDPGLPVIGYETFDDVLRASVAPTQFYLLAMGIFATLAIVLACVGLYGVVAYIVAQRDREIGIRMALGASPEQVVRMVLAQGVLPAFAGVLLGVGLALALGRIVENLLFEVSPRDPLILAFVVGVLSAVTTAASLLPARRASRIDPAVALRDARP